MLKRIKAGDYIITRDKDLYRITNVNSDDGQTTYTIKCLRSSIEYFETYNHKYYREIKNLSHSNLRHLGTIIPEEEASSTLKLLYES